MNWNIFSFWLHDKPKWTNLFFTLAYSCEETLLQIIWLNFLAQLCLSSLIKFISENPHNFQLSFLAGRRAYQREMRSAHQRVRLPIQTTPQNFDPPPYDLSLTKVWFTLWRTITPFRVPPEENLPCVPQKAFPMHSLSSLFVISKFYWEVLIKSYGRLWGELRYDSYDGNDKRGPRRTKGGKSTVLTNDDNGYLLPYRISREVQKRRRWFKVPSIRIARGFIIYHPHPKCPNNRGVREEASSLDLGEADEIDMGL